MYPADYNPFSILKYPLANPTNSEVKVINDKIQPFLLEPLKIN